MGHDSCLGEKRQSAYNGFVGTKNISLPPELEAYVDAKVASGYYSHASEVVRDGIRLMMKEEAEKLEWLRNAVAEGFKSAEDGPLYTSEEAFARAKELGRARLAAERAKQQKTGKKK